MNDTLRNAAGKWPQLSVLDWNAEAAGKPWTNPGDIHLNGEGTLGLARFVHRALEERGLVRRAEVRVVVRGPGTVLVSGKRCRRTCVVAVRPRKDVRLTARPLGTARFERWGGACAGRARRCVLRLTQPAVATATFRR
jgi:hypothetical protein